MIWAKGYKAIYTAYEVDPKTWRDIRELRITKGQIDYAEDNMMQSADFDLTEDINETWVRVYLTAVQGTDIQAVPLFTGLASTPSIDRNGKRTGYKADCFSVLKPAADILTPRGYYIPSSVPAPQAVQKLLKTPAPVEIQEATTYPTLTSAIIAEDGESNLSLAWKVLHAIGWTMRIDGRGRIYICERNNEVVETLGVDQDIVELHVTDTKDLFSVPNVVRCISGDLVAIARDDDPDSPYSTVSRGREVWREESSVVLGDCESLPAYAQRRLAELQAPAREISYTRRFLPTLSVGNIIRLNYKDLHGVFYIKSQSISTTHGGRTQEVAVEI